MEHKLRKSASIPVVITSILLLVSFAATSCKQNSPSSPPPNQNGFTIKGNFNGGSNTRNLSPMDYLASLLGGGEVLYALDPLTVAKVAVFQGNNGFVISDVVNGGFSIPTQAGKPSGMIFIGATGNFLGYLTLSSGMDTIPLNMTSDNVNTIDLQALSSSGGIVEPGHNPVGSEIPMTSNDIIAYAFGNGPYASVIKSPDVDGDGIVDITTGFFYRYFISYDVGAGTFGPDLTATMASPIAMTCYRLGIKVTDPNGNFPESISINGAAGSGLEGGVPNDLTFHSPDGSMTSYYSGCVPAPSIPPAGAYLVSYKTKTLTFNVPDQANVTKDLAIPVPSVILNADGTINSITWQYRLGNGTDAVDPRALVDTIGVQVDVLINTVAVQSYSAYNLPGSTTSHTLSNQGINWNMVTGILLGYTDVFGDNINVNWSRP
jgi:hypothetical protein